MSSKRKRVREWLFCDRCREEVSHATFHRHEHLNIENQGKDYGQDLSSVSNVNVLILFGLFQTIGMDYEGILFQNLILNDLYFSKCALASALCGVAM